MQKNSLLKSIRGKITFFTAAPHHHADRPGCHHLLLCFSILSEKDDDPFLRI